MINRELSELMKRTATKIAVVTLTGPRQSGKSTLCKAVFPQYGYVSLENPAKRRFAIDEPESFLKAHPAPVIIDEAQYAPELFSYIQLIVDESKIPGSYILTGSQNFLLMQSVSQSLAGRAAILHLLPLSIRELEASQYRQEIWESYLFSGFYPRIYDESLTPERWYEDYLETYIERDLRVLLNVGDLRTFRQFLVTCAGRSGQIVNFSSIGNDIGVSYQTIKRWVSILETSFIIMLLPSYHGSFSKRVIKAPKLYFTDPGIALRLLGIRTISEIASLHLRGALFEGMVITDLAKKYFNKGERPPLYYFRDKAGNEIDCIIDDGGKLTPIEIKSGQNRSSDYTKGIAFFRNLAKNQIVKSFVVYGGVEREERTETTIIGWREFALSTEI